MTAHLRRLSLSLMVALLAASVLAGCGKKNKLEPPEEGTEYPRTYPSDGETERPRVYPKH